MLKSQNISKKQFECTPWTRQPLSEEPWWGQIIRLHLSGAQEHSFHPFRNTFYDISKYPENTISYPCIFSLVSLFLRVSLHLFTINMKQKKHVYFLRTLHHAHLLASGLTYASSFIYLENHSPIILPHFKWDVEDTGYCVILFLKTIDLFKENLKDMCRNKPNDHQYFCMKCLQSLGDRDAGEKREHMQIKWFHKELNKDTTFKRVGQV